MLAYKDQRAADEAVNLYNDSAVDNLICSVKPYIAEGEISTRKEPALLARRVYLMNLPYDSYLHEIEALCREFVPVEKVVVPRDPEGLARGYAFVYLEKASDVQKLVDYVDGRHLRSRQIRAKSSLGGEDYIKAIEQEKKR